MILRLVIILILIGLLMLPVTAFAADPLVLPGFELVMFGDGEIQMLGFAGGDVQATVGFYGTSSVPSTDTTGTAPWELVPPGATAEPSGIFTEGGEGMPGLAELGDASEATGNPRSTLTIIIAFFIALASGLAVYVYTHNARMGMKGSLLLQSLTSLAVMIFFFVGGGPNAVLRRAIDARIDDTINSGDATTDGVIDAIRDYLINSGLVSAS